MKEIKIVIDNEALIKYQQFYFQIHTKAKNIPIPHPYHESINSWMIMRRPQMNALKQRWKDFIIWLINENGLADMHIDKCELEFTTYYATNRRHDIDNSVPKFILDGFVGSGFIVDDDYKHITKLTLMCDCDASNPRTEIIIKDITNI